MQPDCNSWSLVRSGFPDVRYSLNDILQDSMKESLTVGRKGHVDIVCNGKTVSRLHCELLYHDNRWYIMDLDSLNGIFVNLRRIPPRMPVVLNHGDVLGVGGYEPNNVDYFVFGVLCESQLGDSQVLEHFVNLSIHQH